MNRNGNDYYYLKDALGSVAALADNNGTVVHEYKYSVFGKITDEIGDSIENPFTYTSRELDRETGLMFYRARYYDPGIGRFISKDPIGFASGDANLYRYCWNNSLQYVDPLGYYGGFGFGLTGGGTADIGAVTGGGASTSGGIGIFVDKEGAISMGSFNSFGAYRSKDDPCSGAMDYPVGKEKDDGSIGGYAGGGVGLFLTNADNVSDLGGPFKTLLINTPLVSIQIGSSNGVVIGSITVGPGLGADVSAYSTNTWVKQILYPRFIKR
jgi:RHS repeat-associated protein